ncbi:MAG: dTDP-4-dehydrorhamnose reductase [Dongiaceae bacterium]
MSDRKVLVFGSKGQLARELARNPWPSGLAPVCHGRAECDLAGSGDPLASIEHVEPVFVVNAAAYTAVDRAEAEPEAAFALNRDAAGRIAAACARHDLPLVHVSTDYVFDGAKNGPYVEDDPIAPISVYGASKAEGDAAVRAAHDRHIVLRTAWVYSPFGSNFVKTMLELGRTRDRLAVVTDQRGSPTAAGDIARTIGALTKAILDGNTRFGTYHYAGGGDVTRRDWAEAVFDAAAGHGRPAPLLEPASSDAFPTAARRPANSALDCSRIARDYAILPRPWRESVGETVDEILAGTWANDEDGA